MKKLKKKYVGKVKNGLLARCPTCKTKGYIKKELIIKEHQYNSLKKDNIIKTDYILQKVPCKECKGTGVILWIDRILRTK